ncbi:MAG: ATP-binding protein [Steroidobacteraceae bacterium]
MSTQSVLKVRSHVGRDLLQSAQLFRHEHAVVWEYVANGLEYKDTSTKPVVVVAIDPKDKSIKISDNGRGMLIEDLSAYFQMHGENRDRKLGKPGRGFFGTGKSAAFGIATSLTITTVRNGRRSKVTLTKQDIQSKGDGDEIPVRILEHEISTTQSNGTLIEINGIFLKQIDISGVIRHIERHIAHWPDASVVVNNHECEFSEPDTSREIKIPTAGTEFEASLGKTELTIKVAKAPLEDEFRGIAILSGGVWHETTLAGCERKPFAEYLFGNIDVTALATDDSGIPPFDMSRSMKLNPRNETVAAIIRFVGVNLEIIRKEIERQDRARRQDEEQKRLQQQGNKIAEIINSHFKSWSTKLKHTAAKSGSGRDLLPAQSQSKAEAVAEVFGDNLPAIEIGQQKDDFSRDHTLKSSLDTTSSSAPKPDIPVIKLDDSANENKGKKAQSSTRNAAVGGFQVSFDNIGSNEKRAKYDREKRTIFINLDHPRISMELKSSSSQLAINDPNFLRMAYEIAFTEYAIVLAQELSTVQYFFDPQDALVELRQTIDELSKSFATAWPTVGATH